MGMSKQVCSRPDTVTQNMIFVFSEKVLLKTLHVLFKLTVYLFNNHHIIIAIISPLRFHFAIFKSYIKIS